MWLSFYKQLSQILIEKKQWDVKEPTDRFFHPTIKIYFGYRENRNSLEFIHRKDYTIQLFTDIIRNNNKKQNFFYYMPQSSEDSTQVKYVHIVEYTPNKGDSFNITRNFNIEETTSIEILSNKIIEEVPFKLAEQIPKYFGSILP